MKLPLLFTTFFLSASPVLADDLLYLKCTGTINFKQVDLTEMRVIDEESQGNVVHYEIDLNNNLLTDSDDPENPSAVKIQNGMIFSQISGYSKGAMSVQFVDTQIAFDPPGRIAGRSTIRANDNSFEVIADLSGRCEASDDSAYEASK